MYSLKKRKAFKQAITSVYNKNISLTAHIQPSKGLSQRWQSFFTLEIYMADKDKESLEKEYQIYKYNELLDRYNKLKEKYINVWIELDELKRK